MRRRLARSFPGLLLLALTLAACQGPSERFDRYVAMGSSTAAGWQSGGIVASTQTAAYPSLLAAQMHGRFVVPRVAEPGCPAPMTAPLAAQPPATACARAGGTVFVGNVAVPRTRIADALAAAAPPRWLQPLLIGSGSQVAAMKATYPTFVSVHLGDDDAFDAALEGRTTDDMLTPLAGFEASLEALAAELESLNSLQGVLLVGVTDPAAYVPLLQPGAYYFLARDPATGRYQGKLVNNNCSPVTALGTPNPLAANMVSLRILADAAVPEINCDPSMYTGHYLLDPSERTALQTRVAQYNAAIEAAAVARGWLYLDPNDVWAPQLVVTTSGRYNQIRKCQLLPTATTAAQFQTAVLTSCPVTGPTAAPGFFGSLVSYDGVYPTAAGHQLLADAMWAVIDPP